MEQYGTLIGIAVQTAIFLLGGYGMVIRNDGSNRALKEQVAGIQAELKGLAAVVTQLAVQTVRLDSLSERMTMADRRIEELRHGKGFIRGESGVNGEY